MTDNLNAMVADLIRQANQDWNAAEAKRAAADPKRYKLTRVMDKLTYHYVPAGRDGWGRTIWFCWSCHRNAAGYFLGWRQVTAKDGTGKRDQWVARRCRKRAKELAYRRRDRYVASRIPTEAP